LPDIRSIIANSQLASREWRLTHLYTIRDADGALVKFQPNHAQRAFYNSYWFCNHVLKARKLGFSTFIEIIYLDDLLFTPSGLTAGIIDYTIEDAMEKLDMMRLAYNHLDDGDIHPDTWKVGAAIKQAIRLETDAARKLQFSNGSRASCSTSLRGRTPQRIHSSELGKTAIYFPRKAREIITGAFNSMTPGNVRNIESTHEGAKVGEHYRLLKQCMRLDPAKLSRIQSRFHFFPWYQDPRYVDHARGIPLRRAMVDYFSRLETAYRIHLTPEQKLWYDLKHQEQGHGMKKEFPTIPGEAFESIAEGAIYGEEMATLRALGRIRDFSREATPPMYTFWDIGLSDYTALWLIQPVGRAFLVLDWFEAEGRPGSSMPDQILLWERKWGKPIAGHFLPHDAETRDRGTGKSYVSLLREAGLTNIRIVPRTPDVWLGIGYVRDVLPHCWFHAANCDTPRNRDGTPHNPGDTTDDTQEDFPSGVACLEGYSKNVSADQTKQLRELPKHDLFSHSADAFRTFAEAHARNLIHFHAQDQTPPGKPAVKTPFVRR
jgi:hypothetical protein